MLTTVALAIAFLSGASQASTELQPKTYLSPSGHWSLRVEPIERSGTRGAEYVLRGGEQETWRRTRPFALWDAVITDDGRVAGFAYSGASIEAPSGGSLRILVLSPAGEVLLDEEHERQSSRFHHEAGVPTARGLFAQPELGRVVVRVADADKNRQAEEWWAYELATGKPLFQERPKETLALEPQIRSLIAARSIEGTPLVLLHWWRGDHDREPKEYGALFQLVDPEWQVVWTLARPMEYAENPAGQVLPHQAWSETGAPGRFSLHLVSESARATFGVERADDGWRVSEIGRTPYEVPPVAEIPTRALTLRMRVPLGTPPAPGAEIRAIEAFGFDEHSRLRFVRREDEPGEVSLVLLDEDGSVRRATPVRAIESEVGSTWYAMGGGRWMEISISYDETPSRLRLFREDDGSVSEIPGFSGQSVHAAALGPNAFVLSGAQSLRSTKTGRLVACDLSGSVLWTVDTGGDVAVTTEGSVVTLYGKRLQVYSRTGAFLRTIELEEAWGREPNYPSAVRADRDGGVLVFDFHGKPPIHRMDRDGALTACFDVLRPDGSSLEVYRRRIQVAPDGRLWTTDGHELLRLDDTGRVELEFGTPECVEELTAPGFTQVESLFGRILIFDQRSRAVHVFDAEGRRVTLCRPEPSEREKLRFPMALSVAPDGSVCVGESPYDTRPLRFRPDGSSEGVQEAKAANIAFAPRGGDYFGENSKRVERVSAEHETLAHLDKRPDGLWFRSIADLALAEDGSLAVLDEPASNVLGRQPGESCVALFGPAGEPREVFPVPDTLRARRIAYQGGHILLSDWGQAWLMDAGDGSLVALAIAEPAQAFGLSPGGKELWAVAEDGRSLLRYALDG